MICGCGYNAYFSITVCTVVEDIVIGPCMLPGGLIVLLGLFKDMHVCVRQKLFEQVGASAHYGEESCSG